ncbi:MAG: tRNA pseudouridine(38-40) synthase TruA [Dysgonamonadaceae bacterium]|jgi:tRNA pseudouridine38-40 synthase|nr:tRNA pseudouridine(38-40) synthase TruA [Dysgonamonadaceae bacterium]
MRYFLYLSYNGKNYCGWQIQPNGISVQQRLMESLSILLKEECQVVGAGRTDTGVHASCMVAHFDTEQPLTDLLRLKNQLNGILPSDIAISEIREVAPEAHARFDAISRTYHYYLSDKKNPFRREYVYKVSKLPDFEEMNKAASLLLETVDFTSFSKTHTDVKTNCCRVAHAQWKQEGDVWVFVIRADRFLRNMVRSIVGTLLDVGWGKLTIAQFASIIEQKDRRKAGVSVPAHALFLMAIEYPELIVSG